MVDWHRFAHAAMYPVLALCSYSYSRAQPHHRVLAGLYTTYVIADVIRLALGNALDAAPMPYRGSMLAAYYLDQALFMVMRFALLSAVVRHFAGWSIRWVVGAYFATLAVLIAWKEATGASLIPFHHTVAIVTILTGCAFVARAVLAPAEKLYSPDAVHAALAVILASCLVKMALDYAGPVAETWADVLTIDLAVHGGILAGYAVAFARAGWRRWPAWEY